MTTFPLGPQLRVLRFATLLAGALVTGLAFAHVLELPQKMAYDPAHYGFVQHTLYAAFAYVGGPLEVLAIVLAFVLAYAFPRGRLRARTLVGAGLMLFGLVVWAVVVQAANDTMAGWDPPHLPGDWNATRLQWELGHAGHFLVFGSGLGVLLWCVPNPVPDAGPDAGPDARPDTGPTSDPPTDTADTPTGGAGSAAPEHPNMPGSSP